ncbi:MAG: LCP family protein, partial [Streptosporangiaceae bacterium]
MTEKTPVSRKKRVLLAAGGVLLLLVVSVGGLLFERERHFDGNIERLPEVFPAEDRATASAAGETWLMLGSDTRAASATTGDDAQQASWKYGAQRTDTIMMVHIPRDRKKIFLVSFPRDSYVDVPGHGPSKINAAYSWGGPPL